MTAHDHELAHIGEVAERTGLSHRTIRYYEEMGLVVPTARTDGGFRLYSEAEVERLELITPMKPLGFSIEEIRQLLEALDALEAGASGEDREAARAVLAAAHERAVPAMERLRATARRAEAFTERLAREV